MSAEAPCAREAAVTAAIVRLANGATRGAMDLRRDGILADIAQAEGIPLPDTIRIPCGAWTDDPVLRHLLARCRAGASDGLETAEAVGAALCAYVLVAYGEATAHAGTRQGLSAAQLRRIQDRIEASVESGVAVAALASACGLSQACFVRAFQASTGMTPHRFVVARRVAKAKDLLVEGGATISEIALACGFADQSHLTRTFRDATGQTPGAYRREARSHPS